MVLLHTDWFVFIPRPCTWDWMVWSAVSAAGPALIHSSVKLKLTQLNSESGWSQLPTVSQKTRLCNQIIAACTGTVAVFHLYDIWVKVGVPDKESEHSQPTFSNRIHHSSIRSLGVAGVTLFIFGFIGSWLSHATLHKKGSFKYEIKLHANTLTKAQPLHLILCLTPIV